MLENENNQFRKNTHVNSKHNTANSIFTKLTASVEYKRYLDAQVTVTTDPAREVETFEVRNASLPVESRRKVENRMAARASRAAAACQEDVPGVGLGQLPGKIVIERIALFLDWRSLVHLMYTSRRLHELLTCDALWRSLIVDALDMKALLVHHGVQSDFYSFFLTKIVTTAALHGHYTYLVQPPPPPPPHKSATASGLSRFTATNGTSGFATPATQHDAIYSTVLPNDMTNTTYPLLPTFESGRVDDTIEDLSSEPDTQDVGSAISAVNMRLTEAGLGQMNHSVGRAQFICTHKNDEMEVLQGSCRFSAARRCFSLCCNSFNNDARGPIFTLALETVLKPRTGESVEHFTAHKGGLRLIMTPVLWEGQSAGSQITARDVIAVSHPPLFPLTAEEVLGMETAAEGAGEDDDIDEASESDTNMPKNRVKIRCASAQ